MDIPIFHQTRKCLIDARAACGLRQLIPCEQPETQFRSEHIVARNVVPKYDALIAHLLKRSFKLIRLRRSQVRVVFSATSKRTAKSPQVSPSK